MMSGTHEIVAAMPGTFYLRPDPDAEPFAVEGSRVASDDVIGIIEVMKMFHELRAGVDGTVLEFLVDDGDVIAMGSVIARVEVAGE